MSDHLLRLIPVDPQARPDDIALRRAVRTLRELAPGAAAVRVEVHDGIVFVDAGAHTERVECPACGAGVDEGWWSERMGRARGQGFAKLAVTMPCCGTGSSLNDLHYVWPAGFARVAVVAVNPGRGWLEVEERRRVERALGHRLREVRAQL